MRSKLLVSLVTVVSCFIGASASAQTCQYVHVLDECGAYLEVYQVGSPTKVKEFDLRDGGSNPLTSVTFSSVPGYAHKVSFVTQGAYLRVVDHEMRDLRRTINVAEATGITGLGLQAGAAAPGLEIAGAATTQYALYLVGNSGGVPRYIVLDQVAILDGDPISSVLLGQGEICVEPGCSGTAVDVAAGAAPAGDVAEEAYASVLALKEGGQRYQQFLRITRDASASGPWTVAREPYNEGDPWGGKRHRHLGLSFDHLDEYPTGVFQTEKVVGDLLTGDQSCPLDGDPTDVALWGPADGVDVDHLQLVTLDTPTGGELLISPLMSCSDPSDPLTTTASVPAIPIAVDVSAPDKAEFWVYVASGRSEAVRALLYGITEDASGEERLKLDETIELGDPEYCQIMGCAEHLAIGAPVPAGESCPSNPVYECEGHTEPPIPCCLDEDDPDPRCQNCNVGDPFDGGGILILH